MWKCVALYQPQNDLMNGLQNESKYKALASLKLLYIMNQKSLTRTLGSFEFKLFNQRLFHGVAHHHIADGMDE